VGGEQDALERYRGKRRFERTTEPAPGRRGRRDRSAPHGEEAEAESAEPSFVVQIHDARTMHFDFRLEVAGVLKSWSVPKGPSPDPTDKRLAMPTEDHPLEYREFEGVIPEGEYGAGTVIVWDQGTYLPQSRDFARALERGHAKFWLNGGKLRGGYALTRFRGGSGGRSGGGYGDGREAWLLVKENDSRTAGPPTPDPTRARSARTRRTLRQVAAESAGRG